MRSQSGSESRGRLPALVDIPIMLFFFFQKLMSFLKARKSKRSCRGERAGACAWAPEPAGPPRASRAAPRCPPGPGRGEGARAAGAPTASSARRACRSRPSGQGHVLVLRHAGVTNAAFQHSRDGLGWTGGGGPGTRTRLRDSAPGPAVSPLPGLSPAWPSRGTAFLCQRETTFGKGCSTA